MKKVELPHCVISMNADEIVIIRCKENHHFELNEILEIHSIIAEITEQKKYPTLTILEKYSEASKEALDFIFSEQAVLYASADAFLVKSLAHKILGNFYLNVKKPSIPTRLFTNENTALEWLKNSTKLK